MSLLAVRNLKVILLWLYELLPVIVFVAMILIGMICKRKRREMLLESRFGKVITIIGIVGLGLCIVIMPLWILFIFRG
jgi:uncharacterized membrane protein